MSTSAQPLPPSSLGFAATRSTQRSASAPWYVWCGVLAITSASIGGAWDVSWHRTIGRDTFWTPAHMAIYACGVLAAVICGYLIFAHHLQQLCNSKPSPSTSSASALPWEPS